MKLSDSSCSAVKRGASAAPRRVAPGSSARGFTLIELIIVIVIVGVLAAFAIPAWQDMIRRGQLTAATQEVLADLRMARGEAMRLGWDVYIARGATAPNTWQIRPDNPNNGEPLVRERDAPDNITISIRRAGEAAVLQNLNFQPRGTMGGAPTRISLSHNDSPDRHRACLLIAWSGSVTVASADEINRDCIFP